MSDPVKQAQVMELSSMTDLLRLLASRMSQNNRGGYLYHIEYEGSHVYFVTQSINGWYKYRGLPITMLVKTDEAPSSSFVEYISPTSGKEETYDFVDEIKQATTTVVVPIINVKKVPEFLGTQ